MSHLKNKLHISTDILDQYDFRQPFNEFIREVFRLNKRFGSKDRKFYRAACMSYFRLGGLFTQESEPNRILLGMFLTGEAVKFKGIDELYKESLSFDELDLTLNFEQRCAYLKENGFEVQIEEVFKFSEFLSPEIALDNLFPYMLSHNPVWVRVNKGKEEKVQKVFASKGIELKKEGEYHYVEAGTSLQQVQRLPFEIQDIGSQHIIDSLNCKPEETIWDCCAGAGGKSLQLADIYPDSKLYASDIRMNALQNLLARFDKNKMTPPYVAVADLSEELDSIHFARDNENELISHDEFDHILIDAPCSGSGTWTRTPENLTSFHEKDLDGYAQRQMAILRNSLPFLKQGGVLYYATCSIFKMENEDVVNSFVEESGMKVESMSYIKGYEINGDNFFVAKLVRG